MKNLTLCEICDNSKHLYKCPNCRLKYCSLACFKVHKEKECIKFIQESIVQNKEIDEVNEEQKENGIELLESEIISEKQFRNFEKDPEFLKLVRDPILQQTILTLEKDSNKEILYSTLMKTNKTFVDFTDYILQHLDEQCT